MIATVNISSWKHLVEQMEDISNSLQNPIASGVLFRGQSNKSWKITNSLSRLLSGNTIAEGKARYYEQHARMEFNSQAHLLGITHFPLDDKNLVSSFLDMQHYSCPTRLVDWTNSPYVALYFAVSQNLSCDGTLFFWITSFYEKKIKSLHSDYDQINVSVRFDEPNYDYLQVIESIRKNERTIRQQGMFTISNNILTPHCELIDSVFGQAEPSGLIKFNIPKDLKLEFLARLKVMNISAATLFPGLDGLGKSITETLLIRKSSNL